MTEQAQESAAQAAHAAAAICEELESELSEVRAEVAAVRAAAEIVVRYTCEWPGACSSVTLKAFLNRLAEVLEEK